MDIVVFVSVLVVVAAFVVLWINFGGAIKVRKPNLVKPKEVKVNVFNDAPMVEIDRIKAALADIRKDMAALSTIGSPGARQEMETKRLEYQKLLNQLAVINSHSDISPAAEADPEPSNVALWKRVRQKMTRQG